MQYCEQEVKYFGMIFNKDGMRSNADDIQVIEELRNPNNKIEFQPFLGLMDFLRNCIPNISKITKLLRQLLKRESMWV